ncbi:MAG: glycosyltransferase [Candidatus Dojkabacteria bacterium]|nr:glycosyltransferase [Candidatus Dojkabacteria bacterium]
MKEIIPVSIIIPAKNEGRHLPKLLESISEQTVQPAEVILADADSQDNTVAIAEKYNVKVIKGGMPAVGRNRGAEIAISDTLFFMDADTYFLDIGDLKEIYDKFLKSDLDLASCYFKMDAKEDGFQSKITQVIYNSLKWFVSRKIGKIFKFDFATFLIAKKDPFERVGGFDEKLDVLEDTELVKKLNRLGYAHGVLNKKIGATFNDKRKGRHTPIIKELFAVAIGYFSLILYKNPRTRELGIKMNKKAKKLYGPLGGVIDYQNPYSPDDRSQGYPKNVSKASRRFWEIFVGVLTWVFVLLPVILAIFKLDTIFVIYIAFLVAYWSVRTIKFVVGIAIGYKRYEEEIKTDWIGKIKKEYPKEFEKLKFTYLCPVYAEDLSVLEPSFEAFANSTVGADKVDVVLAVEEKKEEYQKENFEYLKKKFGNRFRSMRYYVHPTGIPGEVAGVKGGNINWAARHYVKDLEEDGENIEDYLLVTCDSDLRPHEKYLAAVAYKYFENGEDKDNYFYASALHTFKNNVWDVPHIIRVQSNMLTLVLLYSWVIDKKKVLPFKGEEMYIRDTFSSYIVNLKRLKEFKFWDPEIANDDTAFYCNAMIRTKGTFKSQEVYIPTYNDAVQNKTYWKSHASFYKQQHRWGWGGINVPIIYAAMANDHDGFPFLRKLAIFEYFFETQIWYLSIAFVLTFGLGLMGIINPSYNFTVYSYNLAQFMSIIFTFITLLNIPLIIYRRKIVPVPSNWKWWRHILDFAEIIFITINMLTFGFIPYMQAKTEMMLGLASFKRNFYITEKGKSSS